MHTKDYVAIAKAINEAFDGFGDVDIFLLVENLKTTFAADNPRFNADKFEKACYQR
jgi:hypothetical protein